MDDAEISTSLSPNSNGELAIVGFNEGDDIMWLSPDGDSGATSTAITRDGGQEQLRELLRLTDGKAHLLVNGIDRSSIYARCLDTSGYSTQDALGDAIFQQSMAWAALEVESSNTWAACARENGWPRVEDTKMPDSLDKGSWPTVNLPTSISVDQLKVLLVACPAFDAVTESRNMELLSSWNSSSNEPPEGYKPQPTIGFDTPGYDGQPTTGTASASPVSPETTAHLQDLITVLTEQRDSFMDDFLTGIDGQ